MKCSICTFKDIYEIWDKELWPDRVSKIESRSALLWDSDLWLSWGNVRITKNRKSIWKFTPTFFCIKDQHDIVGVNSGFKTEQKIYRSRGLWVNPDHRGRGLSTLLLESTKEQAKNEGCSFVWTMPRKSALPAYEKVGFSKIGDWMDKGVEFGPNCLAIHKLL